MRSPRRLITAGIGALVMIAAMLADAGPAASAAIHCGDLPSGTTVWRGIDSPHTICPEGVLVSHGRTLILDAATGPVDIVAAGAGGIHVLGGTIETRNTSVLSGITMRSSAAAPGSWAGVTLDGDWATERVSLRHATIRHAVGGVRSGSYAEIVVDDSTIVAPSTSGISGGLGVGSSITDTTIDDAGGAAIDVRSGCYVASIERNAVRRAGGSGIVFVGDAGPWTCAGGVVRDNVVTGSGGGGERLAPAIVIRDVDVPASAISNNTGGANALDAVAFEGTITSSFTWVTPINLPATHPLGYFSPSGFEVTGDGTILTVPPDAVVKTGRARTFELPGGLTASHGAVIDATAGGATFTSTSDPSVGLNVCRTTVTDDCTPAAGETKGISLLYGSARLANATARYGEYGVLGWSAVDVSWVGGSLSDTIDGIVLDGGLTTVDVDLRGLTIRRVEREGIIVVTSHPAVVSGVTVEDVGRSGIAVVSVARPEQTQPFTVTGNTVRRAGHTGLYVRGNDPLVIENLVTDSDTAFDVGGSNGGRVSYGIVGRIRNNRGANNRVNAMYIGGWAYDSFTWREPRAATVPEVVGFLGGQELRVLTGATLTIPENAVVKGYLLHMAGGRLDASAGGAIFTGVADNDRGYAVCQAQCGPPAIGIHSWGSITFGADEAGAGRGNGVIRDAQILIPSMVQVASGATSTLGDLTHGVVLDGVSIQAASVGGISVGNTPVRLHDVDVSTRGVGLTAVASTIDADGLVVSGAYHGISVSSGSTLNLNRGFVTYNRYGGIAAADSAVRVACSTVTRNGGSGIASDGAVTVNDSDLFANDSTDVDAWDLSVGAPSDATNNWWGQASGPRDDQVNGAATTSPYRTDASECSGRLTIAPNPPQQVSADGHDGNATVTWQPPYEDGRAAVERYIVRILDGSTVVATRETDASARSTTFSGLRTDRTYRAEVIAANRYGESLSTMSNDFVSHPSSSQSPEPSGSSSSASGSSSPGPAPAPSASSGYWMVDAGGSVYAFGDARWLGNAPVGTRAAVDIEPTPTRNGYWVVSDRGGVYSFGDAAYHGGSPTLRTGEAVTSISATATGRGYWLFTTAGRVLPYGDARFFGDMSAVRLNGPVLDSIPTPTGRGYYLVASDGGIFTFGDATFHGSMGSVRLNAPVQSLVPDPDGVGYWLVASDGGIFAFNAAFHGSMGGTRLNRPVTGMVGFRNGYLMVGEDGGIFTFGDAVFSGSLGHNPPARPVTSVAARA